MRWQMRSAALLVVSALVLSGCGNATAPSAPSRGEPPRPGGTLLLMVGGEPGTLDAHRESGHQVLELLGPIYSLLLRMDPADASRIVPDAATALPEISADGLVYSVRLRTDVRFHDGAPLTADDVVATYAKIVYPPQGTFSARAAQYAAVRRIEARDTATVVFTLSRASPGFTKLLASPFAFLYSARKLRDDVHWYERNVLGSGPFRFVSYEKGVALVAERDGGHYVKDRPYLDGYRAVFSFDSALLKTGRAMIETRGFAPGQVDDLSRSLPSTLAIQESGWLCSTVLLPNLQQLSDPRARRALTLAIDRRAAASALARTTVASEVGALLRPGAPYAAAGRELAAMAGFDTDVERSRALATQLLRDSGAKREVRLVLRAGSPDQQIASFVADEWRRVGLEVTPVAKDFAGWQADVRAGAYDVALDSACDAYDEPDLQLARLQTLGDPLLASAVDKQSAARDAVERRELVRNAERYAIDLQAEVLPVLWWHRVVPHLSRVRGWRIGPSHYLGNDLSEVWLAAR